MVLRPGAELSLAQLQAFLADKGVAKQYWPERLEVLPDLPRTPSAKIRKFELRDQVAGSN